MLTNKKKDQHKLSTNLVWPLENLKTLVYFRFLKECLGSLKNLKKVKALIVEEFLNKQKLQAPRAQPSLLKYSEALMGGALKKHLRNLALN